MFLHLSVILFTGGGGSMSGGLYQRIVLCQGVPPYGYARDGMHRTGMYSCYMDENGYQVIQWKDYLVTLPRYS